MKIRCHCGTTIVDQTDDLPHKAHLIPDQLWFDVLSEIEDRVIDALAAGRLDAEDATMEVRRLLGDASRLAFECAECGRLYVDDREHQLQCYEPQDRTRRGEILRGK